MTSAPSIAGASRIPDGHTSPNSLVRLGAGQESFQAAIGRASQPPSPRDAAERFVAMTFIAPILREFRQSSNAAPPFAPSDGERQFGALLDAEFAHRIAKAAHFPLVDRLAGDLQRAGSEDRKIRQLPSADAAWAPPDKAANIGGLDLVR